MSKEIMDLVKIENGQPVTTSLIIADVCSKNHNNVLAKIRKEIAKLGRLKINRSSQQAFTESTYVSQQNKEMPMYILNRDGAMGIIFQYGDDVSTEIRWRFIEAFNKMENQLKYGEQMPMTYLDALKQLVAKEEAYQFEKARADDNQEYKDLAIAATDKEIYYPLNVASKCLDIQNMGRNKLFKFLRDEGVLDAENCPYQQYVADHRFITKFNYDYEFYVTRISPKGMKYVLKKLVANGFIPNMTVEQWEQACRDEIKSLQD